MHVCDWQELRSAGDQWLIRRFRHPICACRRSHDDATALSLWPLHLALAGTGGACILANFRMFKLHRQSWAVCVCFSLLLLYNLFFLLVCCFCGPYPWCCGPCVCNAKKKSKKKNFSSAKGPSKPSIHCVWWSNGTAAVHADIMADHRDVAAFEIQLSLMKWIETCMPKTNQWRAQVKSQCLVHRQLSMVGNRKTIVSDTSFASLLPQEEVGSSMQKVSQNRLKWTCFMSSWPEHASEDVACTWSP